MKCSKLSKAIEDENWNLCREIINGSQRDLVKESTCDISSLPLHLAFMKKAPSWLLVSIMHAYEEAIKIKDGYDRLPLHVAVSYQSTPRVIKELILKYPQALDEADRFGETPRDYTSEKLNPNAKRMVMKPTSSWIKPLEFEKCKGGRHSRGSLHRSYASKDFDDTFEINVRSSQLLRSNASRDFDDTLKAVFDGSEMCKNLKKNPKRNSVLRRTYAARGVSNFGEYMEHNLNHLIKEQKWDEADHALKTKDGIKMAHTKDNGSFPLHLAIKGKAPDSLIFNLLQSHPEAASYKGVWCRLPLHLAVKNNCSPFVLQKLILAHPSGLTEGDQFGKSPRDYCEIDSASKRIFDVPPEYWINFTKKLRFDVIEKDVLQRISLENDIVNGSLSFYDKKLNALTQDYKKGLEVKVLALENAVASSNKNLVDCEAERALLRTKVDCLENKLRLIQAKFTTLPAIQR